MACLGANTRADPKASHRSLVTVKTGIKSRNENSQSFGLAIFYIDGKLSVI